MNLIKPYAVLLLLLITLINIGIAQSPNDETLSGYTTQEEIDNLAKELDYSKTKKVIKPFTSEAKEAQPTNSTPSAGIFGQLMFYILIVAVIIIVVIIIIYFFSNIEDSRNIQLEEIEEIVEKEDIHDMDLQSLLEQAISNQNYRLALRVQFLILLKSLSDRKLINWSLEKTNRDYIRELRSQPFSQQFNKLVSLFERIWYGNHTLSQSDYSRTAQAFNQVIDFSKEINPSNEE